MASIATLLTVAFATAVRAQSFVVAPNAFTNKEGGGQANSAPFNDASRYQQLIAASQFVGIGSPILISQIDFRPSTSQRAFATTLSNIQFDLSTTSTTVAGLSSTFANNVGANDKVVFSGVWNPSSSDLAGPGNTTQFDIVLNLTTPFLYNPAAGNLLLDIRDTSSSFSPFFVDSGNDSSTALVFADSAPATTGTVQNAGIATRFGFVASAAAPEPSSLTLASGIVVSFLGIVFAQRRRCRAK